MLGAMKSSLDEFAPQVLEIKIVLAGVFDDVGIRYQARLLLDRPRLRIDLGVINRNLNVQVPEVRPPETLGYMQRFGSRLTCLIQPCLSVEATSFDDERIAVPFTRRITKERRGIVISQL